MPLRKADHIAQVLRGEILSGQRGPGARLPTYDALVEQLGVTRPTVARALKGLRREGLLTVDGTRGVFVARTFPHNNRYLWVTSEQPDGPEWTSLLANMLDVIERRETGIAEEIIPLVGVDGRANNPAYQTLCEAVERRSVAGLLLMSSATIGLLPALEAPGLPRVAISAPLPGAALVTLDVWALIEIACARLLERGRRIAVFSPHAPYLERAQHILLGRGLDRPLLTTVHTAPVGCQKITELLFERPDRPDAVFVTNDSLVAPLLAGLARAKLQPRRDVHVIAHCNWPRPIGSGQGVEHIGLDVRELLRAAKECIDAQRAGEACPGRVIPPRAPDSRTTSWPGLSCAA